MASVGGQLLVCLEGGGGYGVGVMWCRCYETVDGIHRHTQLALLDLLKGTRDNLC